MTNNEREALVAKVEWLAEDSGYGHGIPSFTNSMIWGFDKPGQDKPDYKSTVFVKGPPDIYTDEELELVIEFALRHTANYDRNYRYRRGCNAILFGKEVWKGDNSVRWLRKRLSWEYGSFHGPNLPEAMGTFDHDLNEYIPDEKGRYGYRMGTVPLKHVLLAATMKSPSGAAWVGEETIVEVVRNYQDEFKAPDYLQLVGRTDDGQEIAFADSRMIVLAETREKLNRLLEIRKEVQS